MYIRNFGCDFGIFLAENFHTFIAIFPEISNLTSIDSSNNIAVDCSFTHTKGLELPCCYLLSQQLAVFDFSHVFFTIDVKEFFLMTLFNHTWKDEADSEGNCRWLCPCSNQYFRKLCGSIKLAENLQVYPKSLHRRSSRFFSQNYVTYQLWW